MQIKTIKYRELFTFDYNNYAIEMEAELAPHEDDTEVMRFLKLKVRAHLQAEVKHYESLSDRVDSLQNTKSRLEQKIQDLMDSIRYQNHIAKHYGVPAPSPDLPF